MTDSGDHNFHNGAWICIRKTKTPTQLGHSLPHPADPHSDALRAQLNHLLLNALPIVAYGDEDDSVFRNKADASISRPRVSEHICESLLHDAENRGLKLRSHPW